MEIQLTIRTELERLRDEVRLLRAQVEQLRSRRDPAPQHPLEIRWAITTAWDDVYGDPDTPWPVEAANAFPIRFIDPDYEATQGLQTLNYDERSPEPVTVALCAPGQFLVPGLCLPVFRQRGLGEDDAGEWWFLDSPKWYRVKLNEELVAGGSAEAEIWLPSEDEAEIVWEASTYLLDVHDIHLGEDDTVPASTFGTADWHRIAGTVDGAAGLWCLRTAACSPAEEEEE